MPDERKSRLVAITGGMASGKSTVGKMLIKRGYTVIDADTIARKLILKGSPALDEIVEAFGEAVLTESGELDRAKVGSIVFSEKEKRLILEKILHPKIEAERKRLVAESSDDWVFALIPLLFEKGLVGQADRIWLCLAPEELRIRRAMKRDGSRERDVRSRIEAQMKDEEKISRSDFVIDTSGTISDVERQVDEALAELRNL